MKTLFIYLIIFIIPHLVLGQINEEIKGVSIAEDTLPPHESAILEIRSVNKGVKFPSLEYSEMISWQSQINSTPGLSQSSNGLVVFVDAYTGADEVELLLKRGFYFWKHSSLEGTGEWVQLASNNAVYPPGAIIAYSGKVSGLFDAAGNGLPGTRMEGWHICNGADGTPDLSGKFVTSFSDELIGQDEGEVIDGYNLADFDASRTNLYDPVTGQQSNANTKDFHFIEVEEIPSHDHLAKTGNIKDYLETEEAIEGSFKNHKHPIEISQPYHKHKYVYTRREYRGDGWRDKRKPYIGADKPTARIRKGIRWKKTDTREDNSYYELDYKQRTSTNLVQVKNTVSQEVTTFPALSSENISFNNESECIPEGQYPKQKAIDLRPTYYVVLYLIKL